MKFAFVFMFIIFAHNIFGKYLLINTFDKTDKKGSDYIYGDDGFDVCRMCYNESGEDGEEICYEVKCDNYRSGAGDAE